MDWIGTKLALSLASWCINPAIFQTARNAAPMSLEAGVVYSLYSSPWSSSPLWKSFQWTCELLSGTICAKVKSDIRSGTHWVKSNASYSSELVGMLHAWHGILHISGLIALNLAIAAPWILQDPERKKILRNSRQSIVLRSFSTQTVFELASLYYNDAFLRCYRSVEVNRTMFKSPWWAA